VAWDSRQSQSTEPRPPGFLSSSFHLSTGGQVIFRGTDAYLIFWAALGHPLLNNERLVAYNPWLGVPWAESPRQRVAEMEILLAENFCTHLLFSRSSNVLTTSSIAGRSIGSWSQHLRRRFCICGVSPRSCGNSGLLPRDMSRATVGCDCPSNGGSPVNTSKASIAKAKTSPGPDSASDAVVTWMSSGASESSTACGVAAALNVGLRLIGANPYSAKRAWPDLSM